MRETFAAAAAPNFERNVGRVKGFDFLGGSAKEKRVASFETDNGFAFGSGVDEE